MNYKQYMEKRQGLMDAVNALIDEGKLDEADEKMKEITDLDEKWDAITQARANVEALQNNRRIQNPQNLTDAAQEPGTITETLKFGMNNQLEDTEKEELYASDLYKNAWAKSMMGKGLSATEKDAMWKVNDFTHTTSNTGVVIPKTVAAGIWDMIEELYPYWDDVQKTYVKGTYNAIVSNESTDAKWYDEDTSVEDGKETLGELSLTGCELARSVTISFKLREMAIEDFIPFIQRKLARKMGAGLGYGATHGKGKPGASENFKAEPLGVVTALEKEEKTPQVGTYAKGNLGYKDLTATRAKVKVGANELKVYANGNTIWNEMANVVDENKKPIFVPDPVNTGIYRLFGMEVKQDDSMNDGEILMSSPYVGYLANVNREMSVMTEEHVKARTVDYCGYAIVDGGVTSTKSHALLKYAAEVSGSTGK